MSREIADFDSGELTEMFEHLDELRESGLINMGGAAPILADHFQIDRAESRAVAPAWRLTFSDKSAEARAFEALEVRA